MVRYPFVLKARLMLFFLTKVDLYRRTIKCVVRNTGVQYLHVHEFVPLLWVTKYFVLEHLLLVPLEDCPRAADKTERSLNINIFLISNINIPHHHDIELQENVLFHEHKHHSWSNHLKYKCYSLKHANKFCTWLHSKLSHTGVFPIRITNTVFLSRRKFIHPRSVKRQQYSDVSGKSQFRLHFVNCLLKTKDKRKSMSFFPSFICQILYQISVKSVYKSLIDLDI